MELKEYIQHYFGSAFKYTYGNNEVVWGILSIYNNWGMTCGDDLLDKEWFEIELYSKKYPGNFQFILTRREDMTEDQKREYDLLCLKIESTFEENIIIIDTPLSLIYLFKNSIDVFGLIDKGLAIDSKSLEPIIFNNIIDKKEKEALSLEKFLNPSSEETKTENKITFPFEGELSDRGKEQFKYNKSKLKRWTKCMVMRKNKKGDQYFLKWIGQNKPTYVNINLITPVKQELDQLLDTVSLSHSAADEGNE